jgi:putative acetyltransferase
MQVREYQAADAAGLAELYVRSVRGLGALRYSPEQVEVWAGLAPSAERLEALMADGRFRLVAENQGRLAAFVDVTPEGLVHFLYADPDAAKGAADAVYEAAESRARTAGMTRLTAEASDLARGFFLRRSFVDKGRRDFEVEGVGIHNHAVEKVLA